MRTVAHLYDSYETALEVTRELEAAGFSHDDVSLVANQSRVPPAPTSGAMALDTVGTGTTTTMAEPYDTAAAPIGAVEAAPAAGTGASIGTLIGGGAGLLAGIGALAIPGVGPVVAAGWLIATLTGAGAGAAAGGLLGALTGSGVPEDNAHVYTESVRRGSSLVTVRADDSRAAQAETIMAGFSPVDIQQRGTDYRAAGDWSGFDEHRGAMTQEELEAQRLQSIRTTGL